MGSQKRHCESHRYYMLTNRTKDGEYLFRPDEACRRIIRGVLIRCVIQHKAQLVCFVFMSNHFHMILRFPKGNMSAFMRDLQSQIATRVNELRGRKGVMFPEKFDDQALLGPEALLDGISYVVNNPVKHGLVASADDWPGVSSFDSHRTGAIVRGEWFDSNLWYNLSRRKAEHSPEEAWVPREISLHVPKKLPGENQEERRQAILDRLEEDRERFLAEAGFDATDLTPPGREFVLEVDWQTTQPISDADRNRRKRMCSAATLDAVEDYEERRRGINKDYEEAYRVWENGAPITFPEGTHRPGDNRCVKAPPSSS